MEPFTFLRLPEVQAQTGLSRTALYDRIAKGLFVAPVKLGARASGWPAHEVARMNRARIARFDDARMRALVDELHAARAHAADAEAEAAA
jgi:prophage regulatory protein